MDEVAERAEFAQRIRNQIAARYRGTEVDVDEDRFSLHVTASGIDTHLALTPLFHATQREPGKTAALIAQYVQSVERQLTPTSGPGSGQLHLKQQVWCVRSRRYLEDLSRSSELLQRPVGGELVAFVAETLPGEVMRGVPVSRWRDEGVADAEVEAAADANTARRFGHIAERIRRAPRVPDDGWRLTVDQLFSGSLLLIEGVLTALEERAQSSILLANPDRSVVIAVPTSKPSARQFQMRATREWREAVNPSSPDVFLAEGGRLTHQGRRRGSRLMPWLSE